MSGALRSLFVARPRLIFAFAIGVVAGFVVPVPHEDPIARALVGWNIGVWLYLAALAVMMWRADQDDIEAYAKRQDEKAPVILAVLSFGAAISIAAIVVELAGAKQGSTERPFHIAMAGSTVLCSWLLIPFSFGLHYAHEYYRDRRRKPLFIFPDGDRKPDYWDFMYLSLTLAVAFATSDVQVTRPMRPLVLTQSVLAFWFNASVLALSINVSASLMSGA